MRPRLAVGCALVLAASAPGVAQDAFEPNPSLAELSADDAYARRSAKSLRTAGLDTFSALRLDDAGRVLVAGLSAHTPRVARLDAEGRLDPTFGTAGVAEVPRVRMALDDRRLGLEVDAAGRIVVAYVRTFPFEPGSGLARLRGDGSLDPDFSGDGLLELHPSSGLGLVGQVRASGTDGAMLAVAWRTEPGAEPRLGLVRVGPDGAIDPTYGDGFAPIVREWWLDDFNSVLDFAVDSAGSAVVVAQDSRGSSVVQRLDAEGARDASFSNTGSPYAIPEIVASQVALDGADRIVGLAGGSVFRCLPDGRRDASFSGDGFAWRVETAGFPGGMSVYWHVWDIIRSDPSFDPREWDDGLLAVATHADRWAIAKPVRSYDARGRAVHGIRIQAVDPANPGAIAWTTDRRQSGVMGLSVTPDGDVAYALGTGFVLRVDLGDARPAPLPDLRVRWLGSPHAVDLGGGRYRVTANARIRNVSRRDVAAAYGRVAVGDAAHDVPLVTLPDSPRTVVPFRARGRGSVVKRFTWEGGDTSLDLAGAQLSVQVACELPDANLADNVATSPPMTPLYAPR